MSIRYTGHALRIALLLFAGLAVGCSFALNTRDIEDGGSGGSGGVGFRDDRGVVPVITTKIGGKNVFIPSTIVVTEGSGRSLSMFNTTDTPHGFRIPALGVEAVLPAGEELIVPLPPLRGENVYEVQCHLHPPHRGAALVVLRAR